MYEPFYGLVADPFRLTPDPRFCFSHKNYARASAYIDYALQRAEGFVMITGKPGTGKTTLINDLLDRLVGTQVKIAMLMSTRLDDEDLLRMTAYAFGLDPNALNKALLLQRLMEFLGHQHQYNRRALLIIDEAQDLAASALEELRLLTNHQRSRQPLLQIVLIGQESLRDLVRRPEMEPVHQRLVAAWHLEPLGPLETIGYVRHRLEKAGWSGDPAFQPGVFPAIYGFSGGVPRRINLVCSRLLLHGFIEERHVITAVDAETVVGELHQEELAPRELVATTDWLTACQGRASAGAAPVSSTDQPRIEAVHSGGRSDPIDWSRIDQGLSTNATSGGHSPQPSTAPVDISAQTSAPRAPYEGGSRVSGIPAQIVGAQRPILPIEGSVSPAGVVIPLQPDEPLNSEKSPDQEPVSTQENRVADVVTMSADQSVATAASRTRRWFIAGLGLVGLVVGLSLSAPFLPPLWQPLREEIVQWMRAVSAGGDAAMTGLGKQREDQPSQVAAVIHPDAPEHAVEEAGSLTTDSLDPVSPPAAMSSNR